VGPKLSGTYQLQIYADNVNLFGDNIDIIKNNTEILIVAIKKGSLKVDAEKCRYTWISRHKNSGKIRDIKIGN
jgi:hypothetical protein